MKPLKPSQRERKRYLLVRGKNLKENIEKAVLEFIGVLGMSEAALRFIKIGKTSKESNKNYAIVSVNREALNKVRAALCIWHEKLVVEKVSGTLKKIKEHLDKK